jgi:pullulanase/glycogen debranching enzyme
MPNPNVLDDNLHWYKDAIIYELHIKAFCDGDADGIGDFQGLLQKLDYLQDLGVTAIWLLPFLPFPAQRRRLRYCRLLQYQSFLWGCIPV